MCGFAEIYCYLLVIVVLGLGGSELLLEVGNLEVVLAVVHRHEVREEQ